VRKSGKAKKEIRNVSGIATVSKIGIGVLLMEWEWGMTAVSPPLCPSALSSTEKALPSDAQAKNKVYKVFVAIPKRK